MSTKYRAMGGRTLSRRHLLRAAGVGGTGLLTLAAAGRRISAAPAAAQDRATVTFWTPGGSPLFCETHAEIAADYAAVNPNVTIDFQCGSGEGFMERFLGSIAAGNPPEATVLWDTPVSLGVRGALRPIDDLMATSQYSKVENWPAAVLQSCQLDGQTFGLPVTAGTYGIWYNQELFESKGIPSDRASFPKTWDELRQLSKEFTAGEGDRLVSAGFIPRQQDLHITIAGWVALNGGKLYDAANQRYTIDAEPNVATLDYFISWLDEEYQGDYNKVERSGAWSPYPSDEGQPPQFQAGRLAAAEWGSWGLGDLYAYGDVAFERWDVAPYPVGPGGTTPIAPYWPNWLAIPDGTEHPTEAFGYLDYMSGVGVVKWFEAVPDLPTNSQVPATAPTVVAEHRDPSAVESIIQFFRDQLTVATPMWDSPVQSFANDQMETTVEAIFAKQVTPALGLAAAQQACQAELEKGLQGG